MLEIADPAAIRSALDATYEAHAGNDMAQRQAMMEVLEIGEAFSADPASMGALLQPLTRLCPPLGLGRFQDLHHGLTLGHIVACMSLIRGVQGATNGSRIGDLEHAWKASAHGHSFQLVGWRRISAFGACLMLYSKVLRTHPVPTTLTAWTAISILMSQCY